MDVITYALAKKTAKSLMTSIMAISPLGYKGSVANYASLPDSPTKGDLYTVLDTQDEYLWTGSEWIRFGNEVTMDMITSLQNQDTSLNENINSTQQTLAKKLDDVKVDGISVTTDNIANINLTNKQNKLTPGDGVIISDDNIISIVLTNVTDTIVSSDENNLLTVGEDGTLKVAESDSISEAQIQTLFTEEE